MRLTSSLTRIATCRDRRKYVRYNSGALRVSLKRRGLLNEFRKPEMVDWISFNQFGFAFTCATRLEIREQIIVNLRCRDFTLKDLVAVVHNARRQNGIYRYGVQFYFGANSYMQSPDIIDSIGLIEQQLN